MARAKTDPMWHDWPLADDSRAADAEAHDGGEQVKFWRAPDFNNLELLRATYISHRFARHMHEGFVFGVIERGVEAFDYRGQEHYATANSLAIVNPGEAHTGQAIDAAGWSYRTIYPDEKLMRRIAAEITGRDRGVPYFPQAVIHDPQAVAAVRAMHRTLETSVSKLERESHFLWAMAQLIRNHAESRPVLPRVGHEHDSVLRVRAYIEAHYAADVSLDQLAQVGGLSPFHLLRVFRNEVGLPPHAYATHVRITRAKQMLTAGLPIVDVAAATGHVDQSHLNRHFKRLIGVTPGQYRASSVGASGA